MSWSTRSERASRELAPDGYGEGGCDAAQTWPVGVKRGPLEPQPALAAEVFGAQFEQATRYATLLGTVGLTRGLLGPREAERIWTRHLLNSAAVAALVPTGATVLDLGSGAGLPGLPLAMARPDLRVVLVESRLRPVVFLREAVNELAMEDRVRIWHGRAEAAAGLLTGAVVTARAVADLTTLCLWARPLLLEDGQMLWLRGQASEAEAAAAKDGLARVGITLEVRRCGPATAAASVVVARLRPTRDRSRRNHQRRRGPA